MKKRSFLLLWSAGACGLLFLKLYLHNRSINLSYTRQKLENKRVALRKELNGMRMQLLSLKDHHNAEVRAKKELSLTQLNVQQVKALPKEAA